MNESVQEKPRLVNAGQGFSVLKTVEYKGRFLYSKYNPAKAIETYIDKMQVLSGTLIIACSPLLWYGIKKLKSLLPENCEIIALENDENLFELAMQNNSANVPLFKLSEGEKIDSFVRTLCKGGSIKRALKIDFSAGVNFSSEKFDFTANAISEIIATFWKNRITLVKFGHFFSKNFLRNIARLEKSKTLEDVVKTVSKPLLVLGAGEGLDSLPYSNFSPSDFFIIAVDAALSPLLARNITPDAVVTMESQLAIEKAFLDARNKKILLFADLCARPEATKILGGNTIWFATKYADGIFFDNLKKENVIRNFIEPMGSVGLAATYIALKLRSSSSVPVFVAGLDFSYSIGTTHAKGTMALKQRFINSCRLVPIENYDAAFSMVAQTVISKNGKKICSTKILLQYAQQFKLMFQNEKNLFDCSSTGINLGIAQSNLFTIKENPSKEKCESNKSISNFCEKEKRKLEELRSLLSDGEKSPFINNLPEEISLSEQIKKLAEEREYLFLHFPDGYAFKMEQSFLKRIRAETDFFIKQLEIAIRENKPL